MLHHTASSAFIIQSYLSTVFLYAGVYTLLNRLDETAFYGVHVDGVRTLIWCGRRGRNRCACCLCSFVWRIVCAHCVISRHKRPGYHPEFIAHHPHLR